MNNSNCAHILVYINFIGKVFGGYMLDDPDEKPKDDAQKGGIALIVSLALVFFPAFILGWGYYGLIRFFKQKMSVIATTVVIVDIIAIAYWYFGKAWENILYVLDNISQIKEVWVNLLPAIIPINLIIGGFFGLLIVFVQIRQIKNNPHKLKLEGSWLYNFKFRRTPWQVLRRKQTIKGLKEGHYSNDEKAPLGLDEENGDKIAYRYNSEAVRQTLISGAAGSGKLVRLTLPIPTPSGFVKNEDLEVGSTIFGPDGKPTKITAFSKIQEVEEYAIEFSDGTIVEGVSGDHLWTTWDNKSRGLTTKESYRKRKQRLSDKILNDLKKEIETSQDSDFITLNEISVMLGYKGKDVPVMVRKIAEKIGISHEIDNYIEQNREEKIISSKSNRKFFRTEELQKIISYHENHAQPHMRDRVEQLTSFESRGEDVKISDLANHCKVNVGTFNRTVTRAGVKTFLKIEKVEYFEKENFRRIYVGKVNAYPKKEMLKAVIQAGTQFVSFQKGVDSLPAIRTTLEIKKTLKDYRGRFNHSIPSTDPVQYPEKILSCNPYILGAWLGDGETTAIIKNRSGWCTEDPELLDYLVENGVKFVNRELRKSGNSYNYKLDGLNKILPSNAVYDDPEWSKSGLRKIIPQEYLIASIEQRLSLLQGLMDTDGSVTKNGSCTFYQSNEELIYQVKELIESLGIITRVKSKIPTYWHNGVKRKGKRSYRITFVTDLPVFRLKRKLDRQDRRKPRMFGDHRYIVNVRKTGNIAPMRCIAVNNASHQFLLGKNYVSSHNTITMLSMIHNDIQAGKPVIVTDFKRSPELASKIASWAKANGRDFYHFVNGDPEKYDVNDSPGQAFYDALINGGASKADMVLGMREYDTAAEVYKSSMRQLLQVLFQMLRHADRTKAPNIDWDHGGIYQVASAVTGGNFTDIVGACEGTPIQKNAEEVEIGLRSRTSNLSKAMSELQGQMRTIVASEYGRWLRTEKDKRNIDLYELTKDGSDAVILFSLNSDSEKDFSKYIGSLILSDLNAVSAKRRNNGLKNQVMVYIDEFQAVPPTAVTSLLEKSRESKLAMTLSSQSYEQIIAAAEKNGESYLIGILDTCSNFIVHNGATEQSATRLSQIIGKHFETVYTTSNTNEGFLFSINWFNKRNQNVQTKSEERWIAHPKKFMSLSSPNGNNDYKSTAIIINKSPDDPLFENSEGGAVFRTVWMIPNREVVNDYYSPRLASDDNYDETKLVPALAELTGAGGETSILEDNETPVDYLSEKLGGSSQNTFTEEYNPAGYNDEDLDGDFGFEVIDDNDEFEDIGNINYDPLPDPDINEHPQKRKHNNREINNNNVFDSAAPKPAKKHRSSLESSSFNDLFNSNDFDSKNLRREPERKQPVKKDKNYEDEDALPDIDGLM